MFDLQALQILRIIEMTELEVQTRLVLFGRSHMINCSRVGIDMKS